MTAPDLAETLRWLSSMTATSSRDHSAHSSDAALYAVLVGWEDEDDPRHLEDLAARFGWRRSHVDVLRARRRAYRAGAEAPEHPAVAELRRLRDECARFTALARERGDLDVSVLGAFAADLEASLARVAPAVTS